MNLERAGNTRIFDLPAPCRPFERLASATPPESRQRQMRQVTIARIIARRSGESLRDATLQFEQIGWAVGLQGNESGSPAVRVSRQRNDLRRCQYECTETLLGVIDALNRVVERADRDVAEKVNRQMHLIRRNELRRRAFIASGVLIEMGACCREHLLSKLAPRKDRQKKTQTLATFSTGRASASRCTLWWLHGAR